MSKVDLSLADQTKVSEPIPHSHDSICEKGVRQCLVPKNKNGKVPEFLTSTMTQTENLKAYTPPVPPTPPDPIPLHPTPPKPQPEVKHQHCQNHYI